METVTQNLISTQETCVGVQRQTPFSFAAKPRGQKASRALHIADFVVMASNIYILCKCLEILLLILPHNTLKCTGNIFIKI